MLKVMEVLKQHEVVIADCSIRSVNMSHNQIEFIKFLMKYKGFSYDRACNVACLLVK